MSLNAIELAAELIRFDTINPPGQEAACADHLACLLTSAGFQCETVPLDESRPNLVVRIGGGADKPPIAFTGHLDTVPLGAKTWTVPPHTGVIKDSRLWGRGASDMKSGVAAFVVAAMNLAPSLEGTVGVVLYITAGEETGSEGAFALARRGLGGHAGALVVAEPTANRPLCGHKGALWLKATTHGVTAHGSMPEQGVNAVYAAARAVAQLEAFDFNVARHPVMGGPTLNVGTLHGGANINSVPDRAEIGIDIRTIPGMRHGSLRDQRVISATRWKYRMSLMSRACGPIPIILGCGRSSASAPLCNGRSPLLRPLHTSPTLQRWHLLWAVSQPLSSVRARRIWRTRPMNGVNAPASKKLSRSTSA